MTISTATPRPDVMLTVVQQWPDLAKTFIAHEVYPIHRVGVSTAPVPKFLARKRIERLVKSKHGEFPRGQMSAENAGTFDCKEEGFEEPMDEKDIEIAGGEASAEAIYSLHALQAALLAHENAVATSLFNDSTFGSGYNTAGAAAWDNARGKPLDDVATAKDQVLLRTGMEANTLVIGAGALLALKKNAQIQANVRAILGHTNAEGIRTDISLSTLATVFGVEKVLVGRASYNSADEGQTASNSYVWADDKALVCYTSEDEGISPSLGRTFVWDKSPGQYGDVEQLQELFDLFLLERYDEVNKNIAIIRARRYADTLLLNKEAGHLLTGL